MIRALMFLKIAGTVAATPGAAAAVELEPSPDRWHVGVSADPALYLLGGYSASVYLTPKPLPRWQFAFADYGAFDVPEVVVELNRENDGWVDTYEHGIELQARRRIGRRDRGGWMIGIASGLAHHRLSHGQLSGERDVYELHVGAGVSFQSFPTPSGLFIQPWARAMVPVWRATELIDTDPVSPELQHIRPQAGLSVGYEF